jgi:hypothetical protein
MFYPIIPLVEKFLDCYGWNKLFFWVENVYNNYVGWEGPLHKFGGIVHEKKLNPEEKKVNVVIISQSMLLLSSSHLPPRTELVPTLSFVEKPATGRLVAFLCEPAKGEKLKTVHSSVTSIPSSRTAA